MSYIDHKFVSILSPRLDKFTRKSSTLWNFRCPICGDSKKNQSKARGFIYEVKKDLFYKCHNCGYGTSFANLLKQIDHNLYEEYLLEKYKEGETAEGFRPKTCVSTPKKILLPKKNINLKSFADLHDDHPAKQIFLKRKIPKECWREIFFAPMFFKFACRLSPTLSASKTDHPRIVIPFYDVNGELFAFQGRAFGSEQPKYITIILDKSVPKIFGLNHANFKKPLQIVEGPIDSLFLDNGIAVAQGDLRIPKYKDNSILIPDNEPRNKEICKNIEKYLKQNYKVVLWPKEIEQKDINQMILSGMTQTKIQETINKNTHSGLEGLAIFSEWKRI